MNNPYEVTFAPRTLEEKQAELKHKAWEEGYEARQKETKTAIKLAETLVDYILDGEATPEDIFFGAHELDKRLAKLRNQ